MMLSDNLSQTIRRGNLRRDLDWLQQGLAFIPTYVANGECGGLVDEFGLHSRAPYDMRNGRTHFAHVEHYSRRHDNGGHILRSLFHMTARGFRDEPPGLGLLDEWEQELDLWTATCRTSWVEAGNRSQTRVFASWAQPHLWVWELDQDLVDPAYRLTLTLEFDVRKAENNTRADGEKAFRDLDIRIEPAGEHLWRVIAKTDCRESELLLRITDGEVTLDETRIVIVAGDRLKLRVWYVHPDPARRGEDDPETLPARDDLWETHCAAVQRHWEGSGMLHLPDDTPEARWWPLYAYYLPAVLNPLPSHILVADGLTANNWGHGFPQDQWYVMLPIARLGLHQLAETQLHAYNDNLPAVERYTRRIAKRDGLFYPWAMPFENLDEFETDGPTNKDTYQFHNSAYVFAMAWESYRISRDRGFLQKHFDLLQGVARFFAANIVLPEDGGKAVFRNDDIPLRSQDEATAEGAVTVQPLCSVWASLYCFPRFLEAAETLGQGDPELIRRVGAILQRGFELDPLIREDGTLRTSATDPREHGEQKHPIQFNPLTYLPMADWMDWAPVHETWKMRHLLCKRTREPVSLGWTFAQLVLASARMRDGAAVQKDLDLVQRARYADPMWIQFYECSHRWGWTQRIAFYFVTMQIYTQTILECLVQDCRESIEFFPALLPSWEGRDLAFHNLHLRDGLIVSGSFRNGAIEIEIRATRDVQPTITIRRNGQFTCRCKDLHQSFAGHESCSLNMLSGAVARISSHES